MFAIIRNGATLAALALAALIVSACNESGAEAPSIMSEAVAANPGGGADYGWKTNAAPGAGEDGDVKEYY